jgi:hypothetical protein
MPAIKPLGTALFDRSRGEDERRRRHRPYLPGAVHYERIEVQQFLEIFPDVMVFLPWPSYNCCRKDRILSVIIRSTLKTGKGAQGVAS